MVPHGSAPTSEKYLGATNLGEMYDLIHRFIYILYITRDIPLTMIYYRRE